MSLCVQEKTQTENDTCTMFSPVLAAEVEQQANTIQFHAIPVLVSGFNWTVTLTN